MVRDLTRCRLVSVTLLALLPLCLADPFWAAGAEPPHSFSADVYQCTKCHETVPVPGSDDYTTISLKKDIVTLCEECHRQMVHGDKHPVDIRPERAVPPELHLDNYYSMTCSTCHDPHGERYADFPYVSYTWKERLLRLVRGERKHRTFFLRKSNVEGELCHSCHEEQSLEQAWDQGTVAAPKSYVGSERCRECHPDIFLEWRKTVHARYVGDVSRTPGAVKAVFEGDKPFDPRDLVYTLGVHWTQRYVVRDKKNELMVRPDIWSIQSNQWVSTGMYSRSWNRYCAGCHTTGFNPFTGTFTEEGIGCEACHGPGADHCSTTDQFDIVNPDKLTESRRDMVCESCHTSGHDRSGFYRFPVGYLPGGDLMAYFKGLVPKPGQGVDTYTGDGTYEDRHRQYHYWVSNYNVTEGILCDVCKNFRQTIHGDTGSIFLSSSEFCATCHPAVWKDYRKHAAHDPKDAGCVDCHTPLVDRNGTSYSIHDHKFQFGETLGTANLTMEQRCRRCHENEVDPAAISSARWK